MNAAWAGHCHNVIRNNLRKVEGLAAPVLRLGDLYPGLWLESSFEESCIAARWHGWDVALSTMRYTYRHQRADGLLPAVIILDSPHPWYPEKCVFAQVQTVFPLGDSALKAIKATGDESFLAESYAALSKYDAWMVKHRMTLGRGVTEMFCEFDTGHDNSPRVTQGDIPRQCPGGDSNHCPKDHPLLPILAPDMAAAFWKTRVCLGEMAGLLGKRADADRWANLAGELAAALRKHCYRAEDGGFYDVDRHGRMRAYSTEHLTRLPMCGFTTPEETRVLWEKHIGNPQGMWLKYPIASVSKFDPGYFHFKGPNSWSGPSQTLTVLRAFAWMDAYGYSDALDHLSRVWIERIEAGPTSLRQEVHPETGEWFLGGCTNICETAMIYLLGGERLGKKGV